MYANYLNIVSVKRLVLSGHKPVPDLSLTNIFVTIWRNLGDNDFNALVTSNDIHYNGVIMGAIASQITSLAIVYSTFYSDADQRKHQSSASLAFEFPAQMASNAENVSIWWRHHVVKSPGVSKVEWGVKFCIALKIDRPLGSNAVVTPVIFERLEYFEPKSHGLWDFTRSYNKTFTILWIKA